MEPLLTTVDAVLFDLDGTLVETNIDFPLMKREMTALALAHGIDPEKLEKLDILAIIETTAEVLGGRGENETAFHLRHKAAEILEEIEVRHARETQEIPFARDILAELRNKRISIGIVTRNCRKASEMSLEITNITPDLMICREDAKNHKPHPDPLLMVLEQFGARASHSVMVGDHLMDIQSGKAAGMKTIGFLRDYRPEGFFDAVSPDFIARSLEEVLDAIIHRDS